MSLYHLDQISASTDSLIRLCSHFVRGTHSRGQQWLRSSNTPSSRYLLHFSTYSAANTAHSFLRIGVLTCKFCFHRRAVTMCLHAFGQEQPSIEHRLRPEQGDILSRNLPGSILVQELFPIQRPQVRNLMLRLLVLYNASWKWTARTSTRMKHLRRTLLNNLNTDHQ